jgi:hypothetical protein
MMKMNDELPYRFDDEEQEMPELGEILEGMLGMAEGLKTPPVSVGKDTFGDLFISTIRCHDLVEPYKYETAIEDPHYNEGQLVPVECYETEEDAEAGHKKWVEIMTKNPPAVLEDKGQSTMGLLMRKIGPFLHERK